MDLVDFNSRPKKKKQDEAERRKRLREKREADRKKKLAERARLQVREQAEAAELEKRRQEEEAEEARRKELELTGGVTYKAMMRPYPLSKADTNRIVLPPSTLESVIAQKRGEQNGPLLFKLTVHDPSSGNVIEETYSGVEEFTAEEGTVGLPPKTALCLTKERGLQWFSAEREIEVQYVEIPSSRRSFMRVQPRGQGFHKGQEESVELDIKALLERTLQDHFVIAKGDWVPLVHHGQRYELVVKELEPEPVIVLLNTDLEVDILPSEAVEQAAEKQKMDAQREELFRERMTHLREEKMEALEAFPEPPQGAGTVLTFRVRLPAAKPKTITRRFDSQTPLSAVLDWVLVNWVTEAIPAPKIGYPDLAKMAYPFELVESWPGHRKVLGEADAEKQLKGLGLTRSGISVVAKWVASEAEKVEEEEIVDSKKSSEETEEDAWLSASKALQAQLEQEESSPKQASDGDKKEKDKASVDEVVSVFQELLSLGVSIPDAQKVAKLYTPQVKQLKEMGFQEMLGRAVPYFIKYNGRLLRVTNALFNEQEQDEV